MRRFAALLGCGWAGDYSSCRNIKVSRLAFHHHAHYSDACHAGVHRTQVQPSDWGLHLLKQLSGDKSGALPQNLMRRRMRGAQPAAAPVHAEPAAPPATTHPAAALEQRADGLASAETAHRDTGSAAEPGLSTPSL